MTIAKKKSISIQRSAFVTGLITFCLLSVEIFGQLRIVPLHKTNQNRERRASTFSRTKIERLNLPFWDDFSDPFISENGAAFYPDTSRWTNSANVWISSGLGRNAPTLNVATLDGIDETGNVYNPNDTQVSDYADSLVSKKIDLSENASVNPVLPAYRDSVFLSFFYQWQGNGEAPDDNDYLEIDFLDNEQHWAQVYRIQANEIEKNETIFYFFTIKVEGEQFFHPDFQFMIRSFGAQAGPFDTWNIDYVYLNNYRHAGDSSFPDQAIVSPLTTLLPNQYRAMPYSHFKHSPSVSQPTFEIYNLRNSPEPLTYQVQSTFTTFTGESTSKQVINTPEQDLGFSNSILGGFGRGTVTVQALPDPANGAPYDLAADSLIMDLKVRLFTGDNETKFGERADDYTYQYEPLDFRANDTLTSQYTLTSFYAYDDGVAEFAVELIESGNVVAYEYQLPSGLEETLTLLEYIDVYFPPFGVSSNQSVDFFIFAEQEGAGKPGETLLRIPSVRISSNGINNFQRIRFLPAVQMLHERFYIGWRQPVEGTVYIGLDYSNDTGAKMFVNTAGGITPDPNAWFENSTVNGSLMIRPVFGIGLADPTTGIEEKQVFSIYPNPSGGNFFIDGQVDHIDMISTTGQSIAFSLEKSEGKTYIRSHAAPGLYLLKCRKGPTVETHKIVIGR